MSRQIVVFVKMPSQMVKQFVKSITVVTVSTAHVLILGLTAMYIAPSVALIFVNQNNYVLYY
jgi:hypothetical protein